MGFCVRRAGPWQQVEVSPLAHLEYADYRISSNIPSAAYKPYIQIHVAIIQAIIYVCPECKCGPRWRAESES